MRYETNPNAPCLTFDTLDAVVPGRRGQRKVLTIPIDRLEERYGSVPQVYALDVSYWSPTLGWLEFGIDLEDRQTGRSRRYCLTTEGHYSLEGARGKEFLLEAWNKVGKQWTTATFTIGRSLEGFFVDMGSGNWATFPEAKKKTTNEFVAKHGEEHAPWLESHDYRIRELSAKITSLGETRLWHVGEMRLWAANPHGDFSEDWQYFQTRRLTGREPLLLGYWRADEGGGDVLHDATRFGNHGQLLEGSWNRDGPMLPDPVGAERRMAHSVRRKAAANVERAKARASWQTKRADLEKTARELGILVEAAPSAAAEFAAEQQVRIEAAQRNFERWTAEAQGERTTLRHFVSDLTRDLRDAAHWLDSEPGGYSVAGARIDVRLAAVEGEVLEGKINGAERDNPVRLVLDAHHPLEAGDLVEISKMRGMRELNGRTFRVLDRLGDGVVTLESDEGEPVDATAFGAYRGGGTWQRERSLAIAFPQDDGDVVQPSGAASRIAFEFTPLPREPEIEGKSPGDMRNYTESMARRKLVAQGFRVEVIDVAVEGRETDELVLGQIPEPESTLPPNGVVRLLVARAGRSPVGERARRVGPD